VPVTIKQVADKVGVSPAAVSLALNNDPNKKCTLTEQTIEKIQRVARQMHYRPNLLASNLRKKKTNTIGVLIAAMHTNFYLRILKGILTSVVDYSYNPVLAIHNYQKTPERNQLEFFIQAHVDGIIAAYSGYKENDEIYRDIRENHKIPLVLVNSGIEGINIPVVRSDNYGMAYRSVKALYELGHRRITYVYAFPNKNVQYVKQREEGYRGAMRELGLEKYIKVIAKFEEPTAEDMKHVAREILPLWQKASSKATALLLGNVYLGYELLEACKASQVKVPDDVSIVALADGALNSVSGTRGLSSAKIDLELIGCEAGKLLISLIQGQTWDGKELILPAKISLAETTKKLTT